MCFTLNAEKISITIPDLNRITFRSLRNQRVGFILIN